MKRLFFLSFFLSCVLILQGQLVLDSIHHAYRAGDQIIKQPVAYPDPGIAGSNLIWDFSNLPATAEDYFLYYFPQSRQDTTPVIIGYEHDTRYTYLLSENGILMQDYKNRKATMNFTGPEIQIPFPFQQGDTLSYPFAGEGFYFKEHPLIASGRTFLSADASGRLITPGKDTLDNVLRVCRLRVYEDIGNPEGLFRLETYGWYAPGYRYPVMESIRSVVIREGIETEDFSRGFYYPPVAMKDLAEDPENEIIRDSIMPDAGIIRSCTVNPNPVDDNCYLSFELSEEAYVSIRLCDIMGNPIRIIGSGDKLEAGNHERYIPMHSLARGNYVLYITAGGTVKNLVIIKK